MTTRSACKCCLSGHALSSDDVEVRQDQVYNRRLLEAWDLAYPNKNLQDVGLRDVYVAFATEQVNKCLSEALTDVPSEAVIRHHMNYFRVLLGWMLRLDPRCMVETCAQAIMLLRHVDTDVSMIYANQLASIVAAVFLGNTVSQSIA